MRWGIASLVALSMVSPFAAAPAHARTEPLGAEHLAAAARLRDRTLASNAAFEIAASLTTEVGPRLAGTQGDRAAVAWAERKLRSLNFRNVRRQEVIVPQWVRGEARAEIVAPFPQPLVSVALGGSVGTPDGGITAEVLQVADVAALNALPRERVAGRIVFFSKRMAPSRDGSTYAQTVSARREGPSTAAAAGAVAVVIRSVGTSNTRLPHTGSIRYRIDAPRIPAVGVSNPDADLLERQLAAGGPAVSMRVLVTARDLPQVRSANVIGEIPGSDLADQLVLLGAHLDSWDLGTGALDAAGVAIVIAAAKAIVEAGVAPRRTIRVVLFANEEFGLSGADTYAREAAESGELARHAVAMEADLGAGPVWRLASRMREEALPQVAQIHGIELGGNDSMGGSDIGPLRRAGVPLLSPSLDATTYFDFHHTANDTLDKIDPRALAQSTAAFAVTAFLAAQADDWGWIPAEIEAR